MTQTDQLIRAIDTAEDDLVALTRDLIRIPTTNPPGRHYRTICDYLARRLEAKGFEVNMLRATGARGDSDRYQRWNLIARREGAQPGECIHFNSHTDVVEVGEGWSVDPFEGLVRDRRIYGRGACDMKGGLATSVIAAECFIDTFPDFSGAIEISATADEETGGYGGVAWLAEQGYFAPERVHHVIIPEPLNKNRICLGHRGVWWAEIETKGRIGHGSMPFLGDSAISHMGAVLAEIETTLAPALKARRTDMPVVPEGARSSTLNINSIHGGQPELPPDFTGFPAALVADSCRIIIDRRFLIEEKIEAVKAEIRTLLETVKTTRPEFRYEITDMHEVLPSMTAEDAPIVRATTNAITQILGEVPDYVVSPGTYDQKHIDRIGRMKNCIAYGPGILDLAHQPNEWVGIDDMLDSAKVMGLVLESLLAGEGKDRGGVPFSL